MATMTIHGMDDDLQTRLRLQAARHGHSMEEEAHDILRAALAADAVPETSLLDAIRARIEPLGGIDGVLAPREPIREPQDAGR